MWNALRRASGILGPRTRTSGCTSSDDPRTEYLYAVSAKYRKPFTQPFSISDAAYECFDLYQAAADSAGKRLEADIEEEINVTAAEKNRASLTATETENGKLRFTLSLHS